MCEGMKVEYEEELSGTKKEKERRRQLPDAVSKKRHVVLHGADVSEEDLPPEHQQWSSGMKQEEPKPTHVKQEEEDHSLSQEGGHLEALEKFPVIQVVVKSEDDEGESEEKREAEPPSSTLTQHMTTEADGHHCGGSQAENLLAPLSDSDDTSQSPDTDYEDPKADMTCHTDNTHFKCSHCDTTFGDRKTLMTHVRCHTNRNLTCAQCDKTFYDRRNLKRHTRLHTGEKPYMCSVCGKRFTVKAHLTTHTRMHTGEKPFACSVCGTSFSHNHELKIHTRIHTGEKPFTCSVCDTAFRRSHYLKRHMRIHTGEKPYCCSVCNKRFGDRTHLVVHTRTHTGEKVFSCSVCGERFSYKYQLNNHRCAAESSSSK